MAYCTVADVEDIQAGRLNGAHYSDYSVSSGAQTISTSGPAVVTFTGNTYLNGQAVQIQINSGTLPAEIMAGQDYFVGNNTGNTFNLYDKPENAMIGGIYGKLNATGGTGTVFLITGGTVPSKNQVNSFIDDVSIEINQAIRKGGFLAPINQTVELNNLNSLGAAVHVELSKLATGINSDTTSIYQILKKEYDGKLAELIKNPRLAGILAADVNSQFATSDGTQNYTNSNAFFQVGNPNQW